MSHFISLSRAITMTTAFRSNKESVLDSSYRNQNILPVSETFDKAAFETVLSHPECRQIRIYSGMDENLKLHSIIVGVDENNEDILPAQSLNETEDELIIDNANRCPDLCGAPSPLNP